MSHLPSQFERRRLFRRSARVAARGALLGTGLLGAGGARIALADEADEQRWATLARHYFGATKVGDGEGLLALEAPKRAHDAAIVPITVRLLDAQRPVHRLHLIVDKNPLPLAGVVEFADAARDWQSLETRIRINEYTHVRAVGELADGSLWQVARFVKAAGGCSAPAMADMQSARQNAGRMKVLFGPSADALPSSSINEAIVKISHPNHSGMQFDQLSRHYIPAYFLETIGAQVDGEPLFSMRTNFSMSENPVVHLRYRALGDTAGRTLSVSATDSDGNDYRHRSGS